jgi:hypothetical protein
MQINWRGTEVADKVIAASALAIDQTTAAAVNQAKQHHQFANQSGTLEGSLQMRPAELQGGGELVGLWGSFDVDYALWMELEPGDQVVIDGETVTREESGGHPFLRPAGDAEYPNLHPRIRANLAAMP